MKRTFANAFEFDPAKPLVMPFGRYPHKKAKGSQVIDARSAAGFQDCLRAALAGGAPGLPVYVGHPDVPELAARYPDKAAKGWITEIAADVGACRLAVAWCDEPAPGAFIYFSPWLAGDDDPAGDILIDELRSVGLTNRPNSTRFRLPNEAEDETTNPQDKDTMKKVLTLLGLAETATEDEAAAKLQELMDENAALKRKGEELTAETAAANTARDEARTGFVNEREARIGLLLDCGMRDGKVTPATKPVWQQRLCKDFANEAEALARECAALKTRSALPNEAGDHAPAAVLARYEAMPAGPDKAAFLRQHAAAINDARLAAGRG